MYGIEVARSVLAAAALRRFNFRGGNCAKPGLSEELFVDGKVEQRKIRDTVCGGCAIRAACLGFALTHTVTRYEYGVFGATPAERKKMLKKYPDIQAWAAGMVKAEGETERNQT